MAENTHGLLDCGSGCRGFDPRHSPESPQKTPGGRSPQSPPGVAESTQSSSDSVQSLDGAVLVPLGASGRFAIVDACDAPRVLQHRWHLKRVKNSPRVYAQRTIRLGSGRSAKKTAQSLHRFVWGESAPALIDHRDGDGLNCRRENLREATPRQNATNVTSSKRQKRGGYKGVTWHAGAGKWQASICAGEIRPNGKRKQLYLGCFTDPIDAARAYDAAALEHFGEFASVNFPQRESAA